MPRKIDGRRALLNWSARRRERLDRTLRWGVPLCVLGGLLAVRLSGWSWVEGLQHRAFDAFQNLKPRTYTDVPVRVIDIDDESLSKIGQWPWPRTVVAQLVRRLAERGAAVIVFDAVFAEPDRTSPSRVVELWPADKSLADIKARVARLPDHDERLAREIAKARVVAGFVPVAEPNQARPPQKAGFAFGGDGPLAYLDDYPGAVTNLPILDRAAAGIGSFGFAPEHDGIIRRAPLLFRLGNSLYPSLALEALRVAQNASAIQVKASGASGEKSFGTHTGIIAVKTGRLKIPTDPKGRVWVYYTKRTPERTLPAWKILDPKIQLKELKGTIAFIGTSAAGLKDLRPTPLDPAASGVDVHANIAEQALTGDFLERPDWAEGVEIIAATAVGLILLLLLMRLGAAWSAPVGLGAFFASIAISWHAFTAWHWLLDPIFPCLATAGVYLSFAAAGYVKSERDRRRITDTFGRYLSPKVVEQLAKRPGQVELGGETREMTFHFCDIRGFTTISEKFDPHGLTTFINRFLTPMTQLLLEHDGTIDKYMGDCIMAFWNAPMNVPEHARKACAAALSMHARLKELNAEWQAEAKAAGIDLPEIHIGTGLNTGPCVVGNMGSTLRVDYTVLGDDVNLASRLEGQSKTYGVGIVIGPHTREQAPEFAALELDLLKVKGKTKPVRVFTLLGDPAVAASEAFRALEKSHQAMLEAYRRQDWGEAERLAEDCRGKGRDFKLDKLYDLYAARISVFRAEPPGADWDGVFTATSK